MDLINKIKQLNLPFGKYIVFGSGPLQAHGIRKTRDIDLLVLPELYNQLQQEGWEERSWETQLQGRYLYKDNMEVVDNWTYGEYNPDPKWLIENAEIIDGIPFAPLEEVIKWKSAYGRDKDIVDIKLIEEYLVRLSKKDEHL